MPRTRAMQPTTRVVDVLSQPSNPAPTQPDPAEQLQLPVGSTMTAVADRATELSPEQQRIRELENSLALERGRKDPEQELEAPPENGQSILIHFVGDGFTALGRVWYRGQELEFDPASQAYRDTHDRYGWTWLSLRDNPAAQEERYGEVKFRSGPWVGKSYVDATSARFERLKPLREGERGPTAPSEEELAKAQLAEARRRRAAPRLPLH